MPAQNVTIDAALDTIRRAQFGMTDILRRAQGDAVAAFGLGPIECSILEFSLAARHTLVSGRTFFPGSMLTAS